MSSTLPAWARWSAAPDRPDLTIGVEEEVMLLDPTDWSLAHRVEEVIAVLPLEIREHVTLETHAAVLELATGVHSTVSSAIAELGWLRVGLEYAAKSLGLRVAAAGTHPFALWHATEVTTRRRYRMLHDSMRELARREPTFALHVHVGVGDPGRAIRLANRLRVHAPLLLALSANSPYWQGRSTGIASSRTPLFQAFPRVGIPRPFADYEDYAEAVDLLVRVGAIADPTFLWWDVRPQPRFGTVEIRIMDAQTNLAETGALVALVQAVSRLELGRGFATAEAIGAREVLEENRFLAARDGARGELIDVRSERLIPTADLAAELIAAALPDADALGCQAELGAVLGQLELQGADRQHDLAEEMGLIGLVAELADSFAEDLEPAEPGSVAQPAA